MTSFHPSESDLVRLQKVLKGWGLRRLTLKKIKINNRLGEVFFPPVFWLQAFIAEHFHIYFHLKQNIIPLLELKTRLIISAGKNTYFAFIYMWWQDAREQECQQNPSPVLPKSTVTAFINAYPLSTYYVVCKHSLRHWDWSKQLLIFTLKQLVWDGRSGSKLNMS